MPFRAKLRKTFSKKSPSVSTPASGDSTPLDNGHRRSDVEYYKPHEIPKSKYRGRVDPAHQEKLHAFSFAEAFGRRASSIVSGAFSPRGTHAQSRRASWVSRTKSSASGSDKDSKSLRRKSVAAAGAPDEEPVKENEVDDTDVANAGLSRHPTAPDAPAKEHLDSADTLKADNSTVNGGVDTKHDSPFSAEELERAMTAVTLKPREDAIAVQ